MSLDLIRAKVEESIKTLSKCSLNSVNDNNSELALDKNNYIDSLSTTAFLLKSQTIKEKLESNCYVSEEALFDDVVDHCYQLFKKNELFIDDINLKNIITCMVFDYLCIRNNITKSGDELPQDIFDNYIIPLIQEIADDSTIKLSEREKEYFKKRGAERNFNDVLKEAQTFAKEDNYKKNISLNNNEIYFLPVIKCLISFEPEDMFVKRIEKSQLREFILGYRDHIDRTVLHYASAKGKAKIVSALLQCDSIKEIIEEEDNYGRTALHVASSEGHAGVVKELCTKDANVSNTDKFGKTSLHLASINNHQETITQLKELGASLDSEDILQRTPLHLAAANDSIDAIRTLKTLGAAFDVTDNFGRTPLHLAALFDRVESVRLFIKLGIDPNTKDSYARTPLHLASTHNNYNVVSELLKLDNIQNDNLDQFKKTALHLAIKNDAIDVVKVFLDYKITNVNDAITDTPKDTLIHLAAKYGSTKILEHVCYDLRVNSNAVNAQNSYGSTPLHHALYTGNTDVIEILLQHGANVNAKDGKGLTPFDLTIKVPIDTELVLYPEYERGELSNKRILSITKFINYDYSMFVTKHWREDKYEFTAYTIPKYLSNGPRDHNVKVFIDKIYNFLDRAQNIIFPIPHEKQDHISFVIKIFKSNNIKLLQDLVNGLPEFVIIGLSNINNITYDDKDKLVISLLTCAIVGNEDKVLKEILDNISNVTPNNLLTKVDDDGYSAISRTLFSGNKKILNLIKKYIDKSKADIKRGELEGSELHNIVTVLEFSQFENMDFEKCIKEYIEPLYIEGSVRKIRDELSSESSTYDNTEFATLNEDDLDTNQGCSVYKSSIYVAGVSYE